MYLIYENMILDIITLFFNNLPKVKSNLFFEDSRTLSSAGVV